MFSWYTNLQVAWLDDCLSIKIFLNIRKRCQATRDPFKFILVSILDQFSEKAELTKISGKFDDIDDVYFFDVAVQGYDENVSNIDLEEL